MSIVEIFFIGLIILFFIMVMFYSLGDLFRDMGHYRRRQKNVVSLKKNLKSQQDSIRR
jgi:hypothetical protein